VTRDLNTLSALVYTIGFFVAMLGAEATMISVPDAGLFQTPETRARFTNGSMIRRKSAGK
jgi:hypothetical protein